MFHHPTLFLSYIDDSISLPLNICNAKRSVCVKLMMRPIPNQNSIWMMMGRRSYSIFSMMKKIQNICDVFYVCGDDWLIPYPIYIYVFYIKYFFLPLPTTLTRIVFMFMFTHIFINIIKSIQSYFIKIKQYSNTYFQKPTINIEIHI